MHKFIITLSTLISISFSANYTVQTDSFTDKQGQTAKYRIGIPDNYISGQKAKVLIHLHGNNSGTQDELLNMWYKSTERQADKQNLIPITITSPGTRETSSGTVRQWDEKKDPQMLHELLQSHFGNKIKVDFDHVYLWGSSQGTCFINSFLLQKSNDYLGGALGNCGCFNSLNNSFDPKQNFKDNFRFYILGTTEDFLHRSSTSGYEFYRWTAGLKNIRGDLSRSGNHCTAPQGAIDSALQWITGKIETPETPDQIHWQRINTSDTIKALTISNNNEIIIAINQNDSSSIQMSSNQGDSWKTILNFPSHRISSIMGGSNGSILVLTGNYFKKYNSQFQLIEEEASKATQFLKDGQGNIYKTGKRFDIEVTTDQGITWQATGITNSNSTSYGQEFIDFSSDYILTLIGNSQFIQTDSNGVERNIKLPSQTIQYYNFSQQSGSILLYGWDYTQNWKPFAWTTNDLGQTWIPVQLPVEFRTGYSGYGINYYHDGQLLFHGPSETKLSNNNGKTWTAETNLSYLGIPLFSLDQDGIAYVSDGIGLFRKQTWLTSETRIKHTTGDVITSIHPLSTTLKVKNLGNYLELESYVTTKVFEVDLSGRTKLLYEDNPNGKVLINIQKVQKGKLIKMEHTLGKTYSFHK
jgi:hypothetical protein